MQPFRPGDTVYFISNNTHAIQATVASAAGSMYTLRFPGVTKEGTASIRLKASRLYATQEEANAHLPAYIQEKNRKEERKKEAERGFRPPALH